MSENKQIKKLADNAYRPLAEGEEYVPIMKASEKPKEVTPYSVGMGVLMAIIFSAAAAYLGLKVGQVFEAAIPIAIIAVGVALLLIPGGEITALMALVILGLGCAPIYPCIIHATPERFGPENSQALIGVQMASAYIGNILMPPLFGLVADTLGIFLYPGYLLAILALMAWMHEQVLRKTVH